MPLPALRATGPWARNKFQALPRLFCARNGSSGRRALEQDNGRSCVRQTETVSLLTSKIGITIRREASKTAFQRKPLEREKQSHTHQVRLITSPPRKGQNIIAKGNALENGFSLNNNQALTGRNKQPGRGRLLIIPPLQGFFKSFMDQFLRALPQAFILRPFRGKAQTSGV